MRKGWFFYRFCSRRIALTALFFSHFYIFSFSQSQNAYTSYIERYKDVAIEQMQRWKVPASITLAQGLLESAAGQSTLATEGNNHFGIKCHGWSGATIYRDDDRANECFRAYPSVYDSFDDHSRFLAKGQRYKSLFSLRMTDYKGWANGLKAAGYATNPRYAQSLIDIVERYRLDQYDKARSYDKFMVERTRGASASGQPLHTIYIYNSNYYLYARRGDTFLALADEVGISYRKLAKYNERDKHDVLAEGDIVWLKKKQRRASKDMKGKLHTIMPGESMYTISQRYGIRLKCLYKLNGLTPDYSIQVGDQLKLR